MYLLVYKGCGTVVRSTHVNRLIARAEGNAPDRTFVLFHGYNGRAKSQIAALAPFLKPHGTVVAFEHGQDGYDPRQIIAAARGYLESHRTSKVVIYGESLGGMVAADLLRAYPKLRLHGLVLNATPSKARDVKPGGRALKIFNRIYGGPIATQLLRWQQARDLRKAPTPELDADLQAVSDAHEASLEVIARMAFDQFRYMANFEPPWPDEFMYRALRVRYVHAPGNSDPLVKTYEASKVWRAAFSRESFLDCSIKGWGGLHCPTAERPRTLAAQILATIS